MNGVVDFNTIFQKLDRHWSPGIVGESNGQLVKVAKLLGSFPEHTHEEEDELFFVLKGKLTLEMAEGDVVLSPGQMFVVPKGVAHRPVAEEETFVVLVEPASTKHTGTVRHELTVDDQPWII